MSASAKLKQLKDLCRPEQAERSNKYVTHPAVRFIPTIGLEAGETEESINLDLQLTTEETPKPAVRFEEEKESSGDKKKPTNTYKQKFKKLSAGTAEDFIKWTRSLQLIFKGKPCDTAASKFEMVGLLLHGDLRNTWEAIMTEHVSKVVVRTVKKSDGTEEKKEMTRGYTEAGFRTCLKTLALGFFTEFAARKQKSYMRSGLIKPLEVPVQLMASRLRVMNSYLPHFPSPENTSFSTGDMIDIVLGMIPKKWTDKMVSSKIEPRNLSFKELVDYCSNLEAQETLNADEPGHKKKKHKTSNSNSGSKYKNDSPKEKKGCDLCKLFGSRHWNTHTVDNCRSKKYYESQLKQKGDKTTKNNYHRAKKHKMSKNMRASISAQVKQGVKAAIKKHESGAADSSSESDSE